MKYRGVGGAVRYPFALQVWRKKSRAEWHDHRVSLAIFIAAVGRLPFAVVQRIPHGGALFSYVFLLCLVAYDLWSTRKVYRVTLWAGAFLIVVQQIRIPIGKTAAWHAFASWVLSHAR